MLFLKGIYFQERERLGKWRERALWFMHAHIRKTFLAAFGSFQTYILLLLLYKHISIYLSSIYAITPLNLVINNQNFLIMAMEIKLLNVNETEKQNTNIIILEGYED